MKRILVFILAVVLLCACAPKQPKTMEQQAEEARAGVYKDPDEKTEEPGKPKRERKTSLGDVLTIISY